jgi:hypothetical protein
MLDANDIRFIRQEIARQLDVILSGSAGDNATVISETIESLYPGSPPIINRPVMHPYGFASRASKGTISVTAKQGSHPGNRLILGHRDKSRPTNIEDGETVIYNVAGYTAYFKKDALYLGQGMGSAEPVVLGNKINDFLKSLLDIVANHTHASEGAPPTNQVDFLNLKSQNIDNDLVLSKNVKVN